MLRTYQYSGGSFDVESVDGEYSARIPIAFEIFLAPDADRAYLDDAGKMLCLFIASSYGEDVDPRDN